MIRCLGLISIKSIIS